MEVEDTLPSHDGISEALTIAVDDKVAIDGPVVDILRQQWSMANERMYYQNK